MLTFLAKYCTKTEKAYTFVAYGLPSVIKLCKNDLSYSKLESTVRARTISKFFRVKFT